MTLQSSTISSNRQFVQDQTLVEAEAEVEEKYHPRATDVSLAIQWIVVMRICSSPPPPPLNFAFLLTYLLYLSIYLFCCIIVLRLDDSDSPCSSKKVRIDIDKRINWASNFLSILFISYFCLVRGYDDSLRRMMQNISGIQRKLTPSYNRKTYSSSQVQKKPKRKKEVSGGSGGQIYLPCPALFTSF